MDSRGILTDGIAMCVKIQEIAQSFAQGYVRYCQSLVH